MLSFIVICWVWSSPVTFNRKRRSAHLSCVLVYDHVKIDFLTWITFHPTEITKWELLGLPGAYGTHLKVRTSRRYYFQPASDKIQAFLSTCRKSHKMCIKQLKLFFDGDNSRTFAREQEKKESINTISSCLTPAEIPISILLTVRLILTRSTNVAVMIVCFNW